MIVELIRLETSKEFGTIGVLSINKQVFCMTIECPWVDNKPFHSCIPTGQYTCSRVNSRKFGECFEVKGVTNRWHILFHIANHVDDIQGCIGLGEKVGSLGKYDRAVLNSTDTFSKFMKKMEGVDSFHLTISESF
jgi:hypothetical protein